MGDVIPETETFDETLFKADELDSYTQVYGPLLIEASVTHKHNLLSYAVFLVFGYTFPTLFFVSSIGTAILAFLSLLSPAIANDLEVTSMGALGLLAISVLIAFVSGFFVRAFIQDVRSSEIDKLAVSKGHLLTFNAADNLWTAHDLQDLRLYSVNGEKLILRPRLATSSVEKIKIKNIENIDAVTAILEKEHGFKAYR